MRKIIVDRKETKDAAPAANAVGCAHSPDERGDAGKCWRCSIKTLRKAWYPRGAEEVAAAAHLQSTGGSTMNKAKKAVKEPRITAGSILLPQFELKTCKDDETLIKMVKAATGSKKFDKTQLAWYKSQFRRGLLKGQSGKAGHVINQGGLTKKVKPAKKAAAGKRKAAEPVD